MSAATPVGGSRTYAYIGPETRFSFATWTKAVRSGRTFVSNGPLLSFALSGCQIGDEISLPKGGGWLEAIAKVQSVWPVNTLELIVNGKVEHMVRSEVGENILSLRHKLNLKKSSWVAVRCSSDLVKHHMMMGRGNLGAHTSPIYVVVGEDRMFNASDAEYMLTLIEGTMAYLDTVSTRLDEKRHSQMNGLLHAAYHELTDRLNAGKSGL